MNIPARLALAQLNQKIQTPVVGLESEQLELRSLLEDTVRYGQGGSCLILGPRSTGKSCLVNQTLADLKAKYPNQFLEIRLSGFAQGDDKLALREIARQLDFYIQSKPGNTLHSRFAMDIEHKGISDTVQSLLTLFEESEKDDGSGGSGPQVVAVIFVIDEFDRYALHPKQTLLYTLLELCQNSTSGISLIGISAKINARDLMEKRVRSRFSQKIISINRPQTQDEFWSICRSLVTLNASAISAGATDFCLETPAAAGEDNKLPLECENWNNAIDALYKEKESKLFELIQSIFVTSKDVRCFTTQMSYAISRSLSEGASAINLNYILPNRQLQDISSTQLFIEDLSELELALLICAARCEAKYGDSTINFNVVYDEYTRVAASMAKERSNQMTNMSYNALSLDTTSASTVGAGYKRWSKDVGLSAWERILAADLLLPVAESTTSKGNAPNASDDVKMVKVDVSLKELGKMLGDNHFLSPWTIIKG